MHSTQEKREIVSELIAFAKNYRHVHKLIFSKGDLPSFVTVEVDNGALYSFEITEGKARNAIAAAAFFGQAPFALSKIKRAVGFALSVLDREIPPPSSEEAACMLADLEMIARVPDFIEEEFSRASWIPCHEGRIETEDRKLFASCIEWIKIGSDFARDCIVRSHARASGD